VGELAELHNAHLFYAQLGTKLFTDTNCFPKVNIDDKLGG